MAKKKTTRKKTVSAFDSPDNPVADVAAPRPFCQTHFCLMEQTGTTSLENSRVQSFRCPVKGCSEKAKDVKANTIVPREPHYCPKCLNGEEWDGTGEKVALEIDIQSTNETQIVLRCPTSHCTFEVGVPRNPANLRRRRPADVMDI